MTIGMKMDTAFACEVDRLTSRFGEVFSPEQIEGAASVVRMGRAPGRLDIMGGLAEATGSLSLSCPTCDAAIVAARPGGGEISIRVLDSGDNGSDPSIVLPIEMFHSDAETNGTFSEALTELSQHWARPIAAVLMALCQNKIVSSYAAGLQIVAWGSLPTEADSGHLQAIMASTAIVIPAACGVDIDPEAAANVCQYANVKLLKMPDISGPIVSSLIGQPDTLIQIRSQPERVVQALPIPDGISFIGIDTGYMHPSHQEKLISALTSAWMGRKFIDQAISRIGVMPPGWNGDLARINLPDYVEHFREQLPAKVKGSVFLDRFGEPENPAYHVEPSAQYKIRSRTEHQIYENDRAHKFAERLSHAGRTGLDTALQEAGELMYASHWSYGQRCGLGTVPADKLVNLVREAGPQAGFYGARISGSGSGGVVTILTRTTDITQSRIQEILERYAEATGYTPRLLESSSPGAMITGVQAVSPA